MTKENVKLFTEIMNKYNDYRNKWIAINGNDNGFDKWFTSQIVK